MSSRAAVALLMLLMSACQVRTEVAVHAAPDGRGRVEVAVTLDKEAAARAAGSEPRADDLTKAGWDVTPGKRQRDGGIVYRAEKPFRSPDEAERVLREVNGEKGPLRGFHLARERSFLKTRTRLTGVVDFRAGAAAFGDEQLSQALGGQPLGVEPARVVPLDQAVRLQVVASLPGGTRRWTARAGQRVAVAAVAEQWNLMSILLAVIALLAFVAFAVSVRGALRRGRPPSATP